MVRKTVEEETTYPGEVKVTLLREGRAVEYARSRRAAAPARSRPRGSRMHGAPSGLGFTGRDAQGTL